MTLEQVAAKPDNSLAREIRGQTLVWFGILGGALTIISQWPKFITLTDWLRYAAEHWSALLQQFWGYVSSLLGISIAKETALGLSALAFLVSLTAGSVIVDGRINANIRRVYWVIPMATVTFIVVMVMAFINQTNFEINVTFNKIISSIFTAIISYLVSDGNRKQRLIIAILFTTVSLLFFSFFSNTLHVLPFPSEDALSSIDWMGRWLASLLALVILIALLISALIIGFLPVIISPANGLIRRLSFILIGVAIIFGLSEVSKQVERFGSATATLDAQTKP
jgi:hypothetical protein